MDAQTSTLHVGLGHAQRSDAFQCGREAAQMAKSQVPDGPAQLVLVLGPGDVHFKDFVEGVRLVTGENSLVAVPVRRVISPEFSAANTCAVLYIRAPENHFSLAVSPVNDDNPLPAVTSLLTQFREQRQPGQAAGQVSGVCLFQTGVDAGRARMAVPLASDLSMESWFCGLSPAPGEPANLVCGNRALETGAVAIECSQGRPWGLGSVNVSAFRDRPDVYREAVKSSLRNARQQLGDHPVACGLFFFDMPIDQLEENDRLDVLESAISVLPNTPLIGIPTVSHVSRSSHMAAFSSNDSVISILVPQ